MVTDIVGIDDIAGILAGTAMICIIFQIKTAIFAFCIANVANTFS